MAEEFIPTWVRVLSATTGVFLLQPKEEQCQNLVLYLLLFGLLAIMGIRKTVIKQKNVLVLCCKMGSQMQSNWQTIGTKRQVR